MISLALDKDHDIFINSNGNLDLITGIEALSQKCEQRILLFLGEWFLDVTRGLPYFQNILGYGKDKAIVTNIITTELKKEKEVLQVLSDNFVYNANDRAYIYNATIISEFGKEEVNINGYY